MLGGNETPINYSTTALNAILKIFLPCSIVFGYFVFLSIFMYKPLIFSRQFCGLATEVAKVKGKKEGSPRLQPQDSFSIGPSSWGIWSRIVASNIISWFMTPNITCSSRLSLNSRFRYSQTHSLLSPIKDPTGISNSGFNVQKEQKKRE